MIQSPSFLLPRMDSTHRKNIISPKDGLISYDSTTFGFWFFRESEWIEFHWEEGVFENNASVVRNTGPSTDDFLFDSPELPQNGINI